MSETEASLGVEAPVKAAPITEHASFQCEDVSDVTPGHAAKRSLPISESPAEQAESIADGLEMPAKKVGTEEDNESSHTDNGFEGQKTYYDDTDAAVSKQVVPTTADEATNKVDSMAAGASPAVSVNEEPHVAEPRVVDEFLAEPTNDRKSPDLEATGVKPASPTPSHPSDTGVHESVASKEDAPEAGVANIETPVHEESLVAVPVVQNLPQTANIENIPQETAGTESTGPITIAEGGTSGPEMKSGQASATDIGTSFVEKPRTVAPNETAYSDVVGAMNEEISAESSRGPLLVELQSIDEVLPASPPTKTDDAVQPEIPLHALEDSEQKVSADAGTSTPVGSLHEEHPGALPQTGAAGMAPAALASGTRDNDEDLAQSEDTSIIEAKNTKSPPSVVNPPTIPTTATETREIRSCSPPAEEFTTAGPETVTLGSTHVVKVEDMRLEEPPHSEAESDAKDQIVHAEHVATVEVEHIHETAPGSAQETTAQSEAQPEPIEEPSPEDAAGTGNARDSGVPQAAEDQHEDTALDMIPEHSDMPREAGEYVVIEKSVITAQHGDHSGLPASAAELELAVELNNDGNEQHAPGDGESFFINEPESESNGKQLRIERFGGSSSLKGDSKHIIDATATIRDSEAARGSDEKLSTRAPELGLDSKDGDQHESIAHADNTKDLREDTRLQVQFDSDTLVPNLQCQVVGAEEATPPKESSLSYKDSHRITEGLPGEMMERWEFSPGPLPASRNMEKVPQIPYFEDRDIPGTTESKSDADVETIAAPTSETSGLKGSLSNASDIDVDGVHTVEIVAPSAVGLDNFDKDDAQHETSAVEMDDEPLQVTEIHVGSPPDMKFDKRETTEEDGDADVNSKSTILENGAISPRTVETVHESVENKAEVSAMEGNQSETARRSEVSATEQNQDDSALQPHVPMIDAVRSFDETIALPTGDVNVCTITDAVHSLGDAELSHSDPRADFIRKIDEHLSFERDHVREISKDDSFKLSASYSNEHVRNTFMDQSAKEEKTPIPALELVPVMTSLEPDIVIIHEHKTSSVEQSQADVADPVSNAQGFQRESGSYDDQWPLTSQTQDIIDQSPKASEAVGIGEFADDSEIDMREIDPAVVSPPSLCGDKTQEPSPPFDLEASCIPHDRVFESGATDLTSVVYPEPVDSLTQGLHDVSSQVSVHESINAEGPLREIALHAEKPGPAQAIVGFTAHSDVHEVPLDTRVEDPEEFKISVDMEIFDGPLAGDTPPDVEQTAAFAIKASTQVSPTEVDIGESPPVVLPIVDLLGSTSRVEVHDIHEESRDVALDSQPEDDIASQRPNIAQDEPTPTTTDGFHNSDSSLHPQDIVVKSLVTQVLMNQPSEVVEAETDMSPETILAESPLAHTSHDTVRSDVPEVSTTPRSELGVFTPTFDSRSEVSAASNEPNPALSPRIDPSSPEIAEFDVPALSFDGHFVSSPDPALLAQDANIDRSEPVSEPFMEPTQASSPAEATTPLFTPTQDPTSDIPSCTCEPKSLIADPVQINEDIQIPVARGDLIQDQSGEPHPTTNNAALKIQTQEAHTSTQPSSICEELTPRKLESDLPNKMAEESTTPESNSKMPMPSLSIASTEMAWPIADAPDVIDHVPEATGILLPARLAVQNGEQSPSHNGELNSKERVLQVTPILMPVPEDDGPITRPDTLDLPPTKPRTRLPSTASSRLLPGGWVSGSPQPQGRASLDIATGEFSPPIRRNSIGDESVKEEEKKKSRLSCVIM